MGTNYPTDADQQYKLRSEFANLLTSTLYSGTDCTCVLGIDAPSDANA